MSSDDVFNSSSVQITEAGLTGHRLWLLSLSGTSESNKGTDPSKPSGVLMRLAGNGPLFLSPCYHQDLALWF
uniref:Uncharacterized protein n=1 Tax=Gouania willdenowi TaxID=441366 RepID=A0A8C5EKJ4_GOUWI